jgi:hypothetical protein
MHEAHISYSKDFEGSCVEADTMVDLAQDLPASSARASLAADSADAPSMSSRAHQPKTLRRH